MSKIIVTGGASGLGAAIAAKLSLAGHTVYIFDVKDGNDVRCPELGGPPPAELDVLINCAGINLTGWLEGVSEAQFDFVMGVNAKGIFKMTQWLLPALTATRGTILNIVSNASHMPMTTSLAYNASKAAAHIMTLQLARELTKKNGITVFGISPNKLAGTEMSRKIEEQVVATRGWTAEYARQYQLNALPAGAETPPELVAEFIAFLLQDKEHHRYLTGTVIPYGA